MNFKPTSLKIIASSILMGLSFLIGLWIFYRYACVCGTSSILPSACDCTPKLNAQKMGGSLTFFGIPALILTYLIYSLIQKRGKNAK